MSLSFSGDGKTLIGQGGAPEWNLVVWSWEKSKVASVVKTTNQQGAPMFSVSTAVTALGGLEVQGGRSWGTRAVGAAVQKGVAGHVAGQLLRAEQRPRGQQEQQQQQRLLLAQSWGISSSGPLGVAAAGSKEEAVEEQRGGTRPRSVSGLTPCRGRLPVHDRTTDVPREDSPGTMDGLGAGTSGGAGEQSWPRWLAAADASHSNPGCRSSVLHLGIPYIPMHKQCTSLLHTAAATHALDPRHLPPPVQVSLSPGESSLASVLGQGILKMFRVTDAGLKPANPVIGKRDPAQVSCQVGAPHAHKRRYASRQYPQRHSSALWTCAARQRQRTCSTCKVQPPGGSAMACGLCRRLAPLLLCRRTGVGAGRQRQQRVPGAAAGGHERRGDPAAGGRGRLGRGREGAPGWTGTGRAGHSRTAAGCGSGLAQGGQKHTWAWGRDLDFG